MKEGVIDVLMYIFSTYADQDEHLPEDRDGICTDLTAAGFEPLEIDKAFEWLDGLAEQRYQPEFKMQSSEPIRVFIDSEINRLDTTCRDFLMYLSNTGILDAQRRELVLDRLMALESDEITLEDVKWVVLMVLFNQPGQEANYAWMEDLMFDTEQDYRH